MSAFGDKADSIRGGALRLLLTRSGHEQQACGLVCMSKQHGCRAIELERCEEPSNAHFHPKLDGIILIQDTGSDACIAITKTDQVHVSGSEQIPR